MAESIKAIRLKRFRKFKDNELSVSDHNVLVGANNSGKTSILHAIRLFFFAAAEAFSGKAGKVKFHKRYLGLDEILPVSDPAELWSDCIKGNTKAKGVLIEVEFQSGLAVELSFTYRFGQVHVDASLPKNPNRLSGKEINDVVKHNIAFIPGLVGILPQEPYVTPARRSAMSTEARYSEMYRSSLLHLNTTDARALKRINKVLARHLGVKISRIQFLAEVRGLKYKNVAAELLAKLLGDEIKTRSKRNLVRGREFSEMLKNTLNAYHNRAIATQEVIEELIKLAKQLNEADQRGVDLGLNDDEVAFYDALAANNSALEVMGNDNLKVIATELVTRVRKSVTIDWTLRESARAKIKVLVKRILRKHGYPPDLQDEATKLVLAQAELLCAEWAA